MKIIHVFHELKFSGAEIMYVAAAPIFQENECTLMVLATGPNLGEYAGFFEHAGYKIFHKQIPTYRNYIKLLFFYREVIKLFKKEQVDIVHIHSHGTMLGMSFAAWMVNAKSICTLHSVFPKRFLLYPYHFLMRWIAGHLFHCQFQSISDSVYDNEKNLFHNRTIKVYNWYNNRRYFPAEHDEKLMVRKELNIDIRAFILISIGRCSGNKRHADIIKALPLIIKEHSNCLYLHLGEGEFTESEMKLASDLKVDKHILFCGNQVDVRKYLIASDVYLMTSQFEGISLTTIEAMACNIPAILYDVPGLRDFNKRGENSFLIPADFILLAKKTIFLRENMDVCQETSNRAKAFVENAFNMKTNVLQILDLYR